MPPSSPSPNAYGHPLLIKHLLARSLLASACQEIVSGTEIRLSYADLGKRVRQLANSLKASGIREGMRVGVMDWDTHRYLECFFAIPMMGASLFTINVRLSPAAGSLHYQPRQPDLIIVHRDFMPLIDEIKSDFDRDIIIVPIGDGAGYEEWIRRGRNKL